MVTFFGLYLYLAGRCCDNPQSAKVPAQCNSVQGITWLLDVFNHQLYDFSITIHIHLASFYEQITLKKISLEKCSLKKLLNFK